MGLGLSPVRGFYCQAQRLANVFTEYLQQKRGKCLLVAALQRASATALFRSTSPLAVKELSWIRFS